MSTASWALALLIFSGAVGVLGLWQLLAGTSRKAELAERGRAGANDSPGRNLVMALDVRFRRTDPGRRLGASLAGAGVNLTAVELVALVMLSSIVGWFVLGLIVARWLAFVGAIAASVLVARALILRRRGKRSEAFIEQLPEIGRLLANGASAGLSIPQALAMAGRELADPGGAELQRVVEELRLGQSLDAALGHLQDRLPSREVAVLMTTIVIQQRAGGDTVRALSELAGTLEARKDLRREITTLLSGVIFTSYVVAGIGAATILMLNFMQPGVTQEMTSSALGIAGVVVAGALWTVAFVLIRKTTKVEV
jgi:tight adherence protein B